MDFAEDLGRFLGAAEQKANAWLNQRQDVTKQLTNLRDRANQLLDRLGVGAAAAARGRRAGSARTEANTASARGRKRSRPAKSTRRPMSAEARQKIREAQLRRWAKHRRAQTAK